MEDEAQDSRDSKYPKVVAAFLFSFKAAVRR